MSDNKSYVSKEKIVYVQDCPLNILSYEVKNPRAVFMIIHGMCEHKERYHHFMEKLAAAGYTSYVYDLRGHGKSVVSSSDYGYVGNNDYDTYVEDAHQVLQLVKAENPGQKIIVFAHSMGSLIGRCFIKKYDGEIDGLILSGAPYKRGGLGAGKLLVSSLQKTSGGRSHSKLLDGIALGGYNNAFKEEGLSAWISSDKDTVERYDLDPLCSFRFTVNGYAHLLSLQQDCFNKKGYMMNKPSLPILFIAGEDDPCAGSLKNFRSSVMFLKDRGYKNVKWKRYAGNRHEVLNDTAFEESVADILRFVSVI